MSYLEPHQSWNIVDYASWDGVSPSIGRCSCGHQIGPVEASTLTVLMRDHREGASREIRAQQRMERRVGREQVALW